MGGDGCGRVRLSATQILAATYLGAGMSIRGAAKKLGCKANTICEWNKKPEFQALVNEEIDKRIAEARRILDVGAVAAAKALTQISKGKQPKGSTVSARDQVRASEALLNRVRTLGPVSSVNVDATVKATVIDADTDDLLEEMRSALAAEGFTEEEAAAKVDALRSRVRV